MPQTMSEITILRKFFGLREGQNLQQFAEEIRQLSPEDKKELARLAAEVLGVELEVK